MPAFEHLRKAPISEALIDVRVAGVGENVAAAVHSLRVATGDMYPIVYEAHGARAEFGFQKSKFYTKEPEEMPEVNGIWLKSADELNVAQFRINGFTFNRLSPYPGWDVFFPEAMRLWRAYMDVIRPGAPTRLGVRFINRFDLQLPIGNIGEYLTSTPPVPPGAPQHVASLQSRLLTIDEDSRCAVGIAHSLARTIDLNKLSITIDIDAFLVAPFSQSIEDSLLILRERKNSVFFSSVTDKTLEQFR